MKHIISQGNIITLDNNNPQTFKTINWNADYNGNIANVNINTNSRGKKNNYNVKLSNEDLSYILNLQTSNIPIDKRLQQDYLETSNKLEYMPLHYNYISSPKYNEEFIVPNTVGTKNKKKSTSHKLKTHKLYKKIKSGSKHYTKSSINKYKL